MKGVSVSWPGDAQGILNSSDRSGTARLGSACLPSAREGRGTGSAPFTDALCSKGIKRGRKEKVAGEGELTGELKGFEFVRHFH